MGKGHTTKTRKVIGKGKVTPVQVAFIVDRYLSDHNFVRTRSTFRSEASHLISKSPVNEAPKSLLSLGDMLDEYICLKEQKVLLAQEKARLDQEKLRLQTLLKGMQDVINAYTQAAPPPTTTLLLRPPPPLSAPTVKTTITTPVMMSAEPSNFSTPTASTSTSQPCLKRSRNNSKHVPSKRSRSLKPAAATSISNNQVTSLPSNSVAKCLFNPGPETPSPSPTVSPAVDNETPPPQFTSTLITSETIQVSPMKQVSYYSIERNHCITSPSPMKRFTTTRDHVKGRLDFDQSPSQPDPFDFDLPNLDSLGADFNFTDLLGDFDLDADYFGHGQPDNSSSPEPLSGSASGSPDTMVDDAAADHQLLSGMSSTVTQVQGMNAADAGPNSVTSVKSITKCIKVFSPVKSRNP